MRLQACLSGVTKGEDFASGLVLSFHPLGRDNVSLWLLMNQRQHLARVMQDFAACTGLKKYMQRLLNWGRTEDGA